MSLKRPGDTVSNERLRSAITSAGLTTQDVSERVGVDLKTVERWISKERKPHRAHRQRVAVLLDVDDAFLWPDTGNDQRSTATSHAELVDFYPNRGSVPSDVWATLLERAVTSIDLLAFAGSFLHDALPNFAETLAEKAQQDVAIRLLFADPSSDVVKLRGSEEGIGDLLEARCRLTWNYFTPLLGLPGVQARQHGATLYNSLFRFDSDLLVNAHSFGAAASHSPVLHLHHITGGRLFDHYIDGFERTWDQAVPLAT